MSSKRCCVPQCPAIKGTLTVTCRTPKQYLYLIDESTVLVSDDSQIVLHWFPKPEKDIARFRTWVHNIGGEILGLSNKNIYKLRRVCHAHFEEKYCCRNNRISNIAVPTLHMPGLNNIHIDRSCAFRIHRTPTADQCGVTWGRPISSSGCLSAEMMMMNNDHNYSKKKDFEEIAEEDPVVAQEHPDNHLKPAASPPASSIINTDFTTVNILASGEIPLTSECEEYDMQIDSLECQDFTTVVFESGEITPINEGEKSLHDIQIDSLELLHDTQIDFLESEGIESDQNLLSDSFGSVHIQPKPSFGSVHIQPKPSFGSDHLQPRPSFGSDHLQPMPSFGSDHLQPMPSFGSDHSQPKPSFGTIHSQPKPSFIERYQFRRRKQNADESIMQYISELEKIIIFCDFKAVLKEHLRDQLVYGLRSEQIRQRLFAEESLDYTKAVEIACAMEAAETDAGVVEQTLGKDAESGDGDISNRTHGDSGDAQRVFTNDTKNICSVCGSDNMGSRQLQGRCDTDNMGSRQLQGRFDTENMGSLQLKGRCDTDNMGSRQLQGRSDTENMGSRQLKGRCDTDNMGSKQLQSRCDTDYMGSKQLKGRCDTDNIGSKQLQGRCDTDNMGSKQLQGRCDTDNMGSKQLQSRCDTDEKGVHVPAASEVTGQVDLVDQLGEDKPPSSDREDWETEEDLQQLSRKGFKRLVIWVDEARLPMDIDMESFVSCIGKT